MFALLMMVKSESKQDKQVETRAEFLITVTWPNNFDDDVDTYVEDPAGNVVAFNRREGGLMHLDRDDFGVSNDKVTVNGKDIFFKENRETVSLRGFIPGEYVVNTHVYRRNDGGEKPIPVTVRLEKTNPYSNVITEVYELKDTGDERTAFRFYVNEEGEITSTNHLQKRFISKAEGEDGK
jgi:hypothetical protein